MKKGHHVYRTQLVDVNKLDIMSVLRRLNVRVQSGVENGWITAWCVFHDDKNTPNLRIRQANGGAFRCFACNARGNIFTIVQQVLGCSKLDAWEFLRSSSTVPVSRDAVKRRIQDVRDAQAKTYRAQAISLINGIYRFLQMSDGVQHSISVAHRSRDTVGLYKMYDHRWINMCGMVDELADDVDDYFYPTDDWMSHIRSVVDIIQLYAKESGWLADNPLVWVIDTHLAIFGIRRFTSSPRSDLL